MNDELQSIFDGALLSDGSLTQGSRISAYFSMSLHARNEDWIKTIAAAFDRNGVKYRVVHRPGQVRVSKGNVINEGPSIRIETMAYRNLLSERNRWYPDDKKIVPKNLNLKESKTLAGWHMGDGSVSIPRAHNTHVTLHTQGFLRNDVEFLKQKLCELGVFANVRNGRKKCQYIIRMTRLDAEKFIDLVHNHVTPSFAYKLKIDRWVPPICKICGSTIDCVDNFRKYCVLCTPRSALNLRKSRSNNHAHNLLRSAKRAVAAGRATDADYNHVLKHEAKMFERQARAEKRKVQTSVNRVIMDATKLKHRWPPRERMAELVETMSLSDIAKDVGVSVTCVSKKCRQWGLQAKSPEYWTQRKLGMSIS